jgi:hypothetical protein
MAQNLAHSTRFLQIGKEKRPLDIQGRDRAAKSPAKLLSQGFKILEVLVAYYAAKVLLSGTPAT